MVTGQDEKQQAMLEFYNSLLGTVEERAKTFNLASFYQSTQDLSSLEEPITGEEFGVLSSPYRGTKPLDLMISQGSSICLVGRFSRMILWKQWLLFSMMILENWGC